MKKKLIALTLSALLTLGSLSAFAGCTPEGNNNGNTPGGGPGNEDHGGGSTATGDFSYSEELLSGMEDPAKDYNGNLFYVNSLEFQIADPSVIYITEGKDAGYFYAYGTSDEINCHGVQGWRSRDLSHWECTGVAFFPDFENAWATDNYWAPEVIYDAEEKLYYMFYNAFNQNDGDRLCLSVAWSETPDGPFMSPESRNSDGKQLKKSEPVFDVTANNPAVRRRGEEMEAQGFHNFVKGNALDASPFIDPATGDRYLFFSYYDNYGVGSFNYGMKMKDWYTPDYSTLTALTQPGYSTIERALAGQSPDRNEGNVNEGPFMMYRNGKYYLTFSVFGYQDPEYKVIQAISDSPLGKYEKISPEKGGKVISSDTANWDHIVSAGHHAFITVGDELFIAYHTFKDRVSIAGGRALAVDKVVWLENEDGIEVMHTNGPTWSVQPLPAELSHYENIASEATVKAGNTAAGSDAALLTDGVIKYQEYDLATEYEANAGTSEITLEWDDYKTVRALMIYNSYDFYHAFEKIDSVEIEYLKAGGGSEKLTIKDLAFDSGWHVDADYEFMRPGGAAIAEFYDMPVKRISIKVSSKDLSETSASDYGVEEALALNEIVVLGKDTAAEGVSKFEKYEYQNAEVGSAHIENVSANFGVVSIDGKPSALATMYGYDLSHDDGSADAYIEQRGARDQYAYFKDLYATEFYIEAEITVTSSKSFAKDMWPKFGIAISCNEAIATNTIFYYVDADPNYTQQRVGAAQRKLDNSDWSWGANERLKEMGGIKYSNGNYVKLAALRLGGTFYFFCDGRLAMKIADFNVFNEQQRAAVGFLTFNTPMRIKNYTVTADHAAVEAKMAELGIENN